MFADFMYFFHVFYIPVCAMYTVLTGTFGLTTIVTMGLIAVDRYMAIVRGSRIGMKRTFVGIICSWLYSALLMTPPLYGWNRVILEGSATSCTIDYLTRELNEISYIICIVVAGFCVPLVVTIVSYVGICKHVYVQGREMRTFPLTTTPCRRNTDIKLAKLAAVMIILFCVCWLPYTVECIIGVFGDQKLLTPPVTAMPALFAKMSRLANPIVYTSLFNQKFRAVRRALLPPTLRAKLCVRKKAEPEPHPQVAVITLEDVACSLRSSMAAQSGPYSLDTRL